MRTRTNGRAFSIAGFLLAIGLGGALVGCITDGAEPQIDEIDRAQPATTIKAPEELAPLLKSCEAYNGTSCSITGQRFPCDTGTPDPGECFCTGHFYSCN
ncbi:MAG TPA: hypothetical protein VN253_05925 [Kofleriaceae bacterium]|nr:hypothetical protein [Kofleriaceae bacterium]